MWEWRRENVTGLESILFETNKMIATRLGALSNSELHPPAVGALEINEKCRGHEKEPALPVDSEVY